MQCVSKGCTQVLIISCSLFSNGACLSWINHPGWPLLSVHTLSLAYYIYHYCMHLLRSCRHWPYYWSTFRPLAMKP
ncbi:hypothetical protein V8F44DRAFT_620178 [Aspergillus fumigatus]